MTIDEIIEKEELKVDALLKSLAENTTSFAVEDFINDIMILRLQMLMAGVV